MMSFKYLHRLTYIDVGSEGRCSDGGVFANTSLVKAVEDCSLHLPEPRKPPGGDVTLPYVFMGDEAFPLRIRI